MAAFFKSLFERGLHGVDLIVSDAHAGLPEARRACVHGVLWQRCQFHLLHNALAHVPRQELKRELMDDLHSVFDAADERAAQEQLQRVVRKHQASAPALAAWMEENVPEGLAVFGLPASHRRRLRTTNMLERLNRELKRSVIPALNAPRIAGGARAEAVGFVVVDEGLLRRVEFQRPVEHPGHGGGVAGDVRVAHHARIGRCLAARFDAVEEIAGMGADVETVRFLGFRGEGDSPLLFRDPARRWCPSTKGDGRPGVRS